jgi:hypothetical protein
LRNSSGRHGRAGFILTPNSQMGSQDETSSNSIVATRWIG